MTVARFAFQEHCCQLLPEGVILNVGSNDDPGRLKERVGDRVKNCDLHDYDVTRDIRNVLTLDHKFDATKTWPLEDDSASLVILGDIIEHLEINQMVTCLLEARRVGAYVCITTPQDERILEPGVRPDPVENDGWAHITVVTCELLHRVLWATGWTNIYEWMTVDYITVPVGFFVLAGR